MRKTVCRVKRLVMGSLFAVGMAWTLPAAAQTLTLKMAHIYPPGNIWYETAEAYAKAVEQKSGGKVKIQIAHSGTTGDWPASIEAMKIGTNDLVLQSVGTLDRYNPIAGIEAYPYLVRDLGHFRKVYHGPVGRELYDEISAKTQFRIIGAGYRGARQMTSNKMVRNLADLKGVKLRVPPLKMYRTTWEMLGASATPMGAAEIFTSLSQNVVDGQENPLELVEGMKFNEVQKYVIETAHILGAMTFMMHEPRFKSLPPDVSKLLAEEGEKVMQEATDRMVTLEGEIKKRLQSKGMQFVSVDTAPFRERLLPLSKEFPQLEPWVQKIQAVK